MVRLVNAVTKTGKSCLQEWVSQVQNKLIGTDSLTSVIECMCLLSVHCSLVTTDTKYPVIGLTVAKFTCNSTSRTCGLTSSNPAYCSAWV